MKKLGFCVAALPMLVSCGVVPPQVGYQTYAISSDGNKDFGYPFRNRRSVLRIKQEAGAFKIDAAPFELDTKGKYTPLYMISGTDDFRAVTQLKITYIDNTKMPDKIDITTKDNVADTINKIGSGIAALVPVLAGVVSAPAAGPAPPAFKDTVLDPEEVAPGEWFNDEVNSSYCLKIEDIAVETNVSVGEYIESRKGKKVVDFPVPSCATAVVHIAQCAKKDSATKLRVTYAAFDKVTPMPLPSTGSLKMNSVCGAAVTEADKQDRSDLNTYLQTLITNVNNIKAAAKKK